MAALERHHAHVHLLVEKDLDRALRGLHTRVVAIEAQDRPWRRALQQARLLRGERGATRGHRRQNPRFDRPGDIEVALHDDRAARLSNLFLRPTQAIERAALLISGAFRRIQVLGLVGRIESARAEGHNTAPIGQDGKDGAVAEAVVETSLASNGEAGHLDEFVSELNLQRADQVLPGVACGPRADELQSLVRELSSLQVLARATACVGPEELLVLTRRRLENRLDLDAHPVFGRLFPGIGNRHTESSGQGLDRILEREAFFELDELNHVTARPAAETMKDRRIVSHRERRGFLLMEWTQSLVRAAHLAKHHVLRDDGHDVGAALELVHEGGRIETHRRNSTMVAPAPPSRGAPSRKAVT